MPSSGSIGSSPPSAVVEPALEPGGDEPARSIPLAVWLTVAGFALAYALYSLFRHWHFRSSAYDLGIFDQAVWHLSRFETPASTITGHTTLFSDHFHPILILLAPLYWIAARPEMLLLAQAALLALSIVPVFVYSRSRIGARPALLIAIAYGLFWPIQKTAGFDFHEVAFAPLAIASAILAMEQRRWTLFWVAVTALGCIKEDLIPLVGMFGLRLVALGQVRKGIAAIVIAVLAFLAVIKLVMPLIGDEDSYPYWQSHLTVLDQGPLATVVQLFTPPEKLRTVAMWLVPFALLPLRSPLVLLALPFALSRLMSSSPNHWGTAFHYSAPMAPILAMAAADGLARLLKGRSMEQRRRLVVALPVLVCMMCAVLPGRLPLWRVLAPSHYRSTIEDRTGFEALALIPSTASVTALYVVVPHVSARHMVYGLDSETPDTDFVIVTAHRTAWPNRDFAQVQELLQARTARGYRTIFDRDGWVVLSR